MRRLPLLGNPVSCTTFPRFSQLFVNVKTNRYPERSRELCLQRREGWSVAQRGATTPRSLPDPQFSGLRSSGRAAAATARLLCRLGVHLDESPHV